MRPAGRQVAIPVLDEQSQEADNSSGEDTALCILSCIFFGVTVEAEDAEIAEGADETEPLLSIGPDSKHNEHFSVDFASFKYFRSAEVTCIHDAWYVLPQAPLQQSPLGRRDPANK